MASAPIALFVYNRLAHTQQTVRALLANELSAQSDLFIFSDGPKDGVDPDVDKVRAYLRTITGFKRVVLIEAPKNKGLANSIIDGVTQVVNEYGRIIVVEDDLVTAPCFLRYMNEALDVYEDKDQVACIHGYIYPIKGLPEAFFIKGADCWGWATWKRSWALFERDGKKLHKQIIARGLAKEFDFNGTAGYMRMLKNQISGKNNSWAIRWYASAFINNRLCLYPGKSLVCNIGLDGSGTHCKKGDIPLMNNCEFDLPKVFCLPDIPICESDSCRKMMEQYFLSPKKSFWHRIFKKEKDGFLRTLTFFNVFSFSYKKKRDKRSKYGYSGDFKTFAEAQKYASGYDQSNILESTLQATLKVKYGEAVFERDSCLFDQVQYSFPLLAALQKVGIEYGTLSVLDFGGALGSHYYQNRTFLHPLPIKKWTVVEQPHYVKIGQEKIADGILDFAYSINEVESPSVLILSSVLPYLDDPYAWLQKLISKGVPYIIVDRTAFNGEARDRLTVQRVPPSIYKASYPAWFLDKSRFLKQMGQQYELLAEWDVVIDHANIPSYFLGFLFKRKQHNESKQ